MARKKKTADPLTDLLTAAKSETLIRLIAELAEDRPMCGANASTF